MPSDESNIYNFSDSDLKHIDVAHLAHDAVKRRAEDLAQHLITESAHHVQAATCDIDAIKECIDTLEGAGFRVTSRVTRDGSRGCAFLHPSLHATLRGECDTLGDAELGASLGLYGVDVYTDIAIPHDEGVVLHPDALAPMPPGASRPWMVKYPAGVVHLTVTGG